MKKETKKIIANLSARIIINEGVESFQVAKKKAIKKLGLPKTSPLPSNQDIENYILEYNRIFNQDETKFYLYHLKKSAFNFMDKLSNFNPFLTGQVLSGAIGKINKIEIFLFIDDIKNFVFFLINENIKFEEKLRLFFVNNTEQKVPQFFLVYEDVDFKICVFDRGEINMKISIKFKGEDIKRISRAEFKLSENL